MPHCMWHLADVHRFGSVNRWTRQKSLVFVAPICRDAVMVWFVGAARFLTSAYSSNWTLTEGLILLSFLIWIVPFGRSELQNFDCNHWNVNKMFLPFYHLSWTSEEREPTVNYFYKLSVDVFCNRTCYWKKRFNKVLRNLFFSLSFIASWESSVRSGNG